MYNSDSSFVQTHPLYVVQARLAAKTISLIIILLGGVVMAGWILNINEIKSVVSGLATMKFNTAFMFFISGISLWVYITYPGSQKVRQLLAATIIFISLLILGEYIFRQNFGIDQFLFKDTNQGEQYPGRPSLGTAMSFFILGFALFHLHGSPKKWFQELLPVLVFFIALLAFIGYLYSASSLYKITIYSSMALHTSIGLLLLSPCILLVNPEDGIVRQILLDTTGGKVLRRLLPISILLPIVLGWIRLMGQYAGLYDTNFGLAIMVITLLTSQTIFIWMNAIQLTKIDTKQLQYERDLVDREMKLSKIFESLPVGVSIIDSERKVLFTNPALNRILRISEEGLHTGTYKAREYRRANGTPMAVEEFPSVKAAKEGKAVNDMEIGVVLEDGNMIWTSVSAIPVSFIDWKVLMLTSDITERKHIEQALEQQHKLLSTIVDILPVELYVKDKQRRFLIINKLAATTRGIQNTNDAIGKRDEDFLPEEYAQAFIHEDEIILQTGESIINDEYTSPHKQKEKQWFSRTKIPFKDDDDNTIGLIEIGNEITKIKMVEEELIKINAELEERVNQRTAELAQANEQLHQMSIIDELTGLYNRRGLVLLAEEQFLLARRSKRNMLFFYADLDGLKPINDSFGHQAGDLAIIQAAQVIKNVFRVSDIKVRMGGDEFVILAIEAHKNDAPKLLSRLQGRLAESNLSMSVGMVSFDSQSDLPLDEILTRADKAMYKEKQKKTGHRARSK